MTKNLGFHDLFEKYDVPTPRYTSYPPIPFWGTEALPQATWIQDLEKSMLPPKADGFGIYIHLPFCRKLCLYCGCHRVIRKETSWNQPYIDALKNEWGIYRQHISAWPELVNLHLGGGTPTFFSPPELHDIISFVLQDLKLSSDADFSFEADPRVTSAGHLRTLYNLGFRRISLGVQDFDSKVQTTIGREQSYGLVKSLTEAARSIGYTSVNYDLIYGLPKQTPQSIESTIRLVEKLRPDRIAFYAYASVPDIAKQQRVFKAKDIPINSAKRELFELGRQLLLHAGYDELGMDHFALPTDSLAQAHKSKSLHRNFMGYVPHHVKPLIGLGASAIGDSGLSYSQNEKDVLAYIQSATKSILPLTRGYSLTEKDLIIKRQIQELMTQFRVTYGTEFKNIPEFSIIQSQLQEFSSDQLIIFDAEGFELTALGECFSRNIAKALDISTRA